MLVNDDYFVRLPYRLDNGLTIQWRDSAKIENLDVNSIFRQDLRRFQSGVQHGRIGNYAQIAPFARPASFSKRNHVILCRHLALNPAIQIFVLEENDRVVIANRSLNQTLGVISGCRANNFQAGVVHEPHLRILRVKRSAMDIATAWSA